MRFWSSSIRFLTVLVSTVSVAIASLLSDQGSKWVYLAALLGSLMAGLLASTLFARHEERTVIEPDELVRNIARIERATRQEAAKESGEDRRLNIREIPDTLIRLELWTGEDVANYRKALDLRNRIVHNPDRDTLNRTEIEDLIRVTDHLLKKIPGSREES